MSEAKHTPGPFTAECVTTEALHDVCLGYDVPGEGRPILLATAWGDAPDEGPISHAEAEANARLFAASPDLLAVAAEAARICSIPRPSAQADALDRLRPLAEAAVAKAKGDGPCRT